MSTLITVLRDGATFSNTEGTIIIETDSELSTEIESDIDDGDPRTLHEAVESGDVPGNIYNIEALIALYKRVKKLRLPGVTKEIDEVES